MLPRDGGCLVTGLWGTLRRVEDTEVADCAVELADGRTIAWTDVGPADGVVVLRFPGTPGSRWSIRADRRPWRERSVRMITGERPGYGRSTRLPGRGFAEHADDMARLLDHLDLDRADLPPAAPAGHARAIDARRVRGDHDPNRHPGGLTELVTSLCSRPSRHVWRLHSLEA